MPIVFRLGRFFARSKITTSVPICGPSTDMSANMPAVCPWAVGNLTSFCAIVKEIRPRSLTAAASFRRGVALTWTACYPTLDPVVDIKHLADSGDERNTEVSVVYQQEKTREDRAGHNYRRTGMKGRSDQRKKGKPGSRRSCPSYRCWWWGLVLFWPNRDWPGRGGWEGAMRQTSVGSCGGRETL